MYITFNSFWRDVLNSLKLLSNNDSIIIPENVLHTPIWYNYRLGLPIKREWIGKGKYIVFGVVNDMRVPPFIDEFEDKYGINTNVLEYGEFCIKINDFSYCYEKSLYTPVTPRNCMLNMILSLDKRSVSNI